MSATVSICKNVFMPVICNERQVTGLTDLQRPNDWDCVRTQDFRHFGISRSRSDSSIISRLRLLQIGKPTKRVLPA
jgi:hypothetical protein